MKFLLISMLIIFCPLVFAEPDIFTEDTTMMILAGLSGIFYIASTAVIILILIKFFKTWNHTNRILEEIIKILDKKNK